MKLAVNLLLFVFLTFLSAPTIISLIEKESDMSSFYSVSEEEKTIKEVKAEFKFDTDDELITFFAPSSTLILSENLSKHDNIASAIFIPPPDCI